MKVLTCGPWSDTRQCPACDSLLLLDEKDLKLMKGKYSHWADEAPYRVTCMVCNTSFRVDIPIGKQKDGRVAIRSTFLALDEINALPKGKNDVV